MIRRAVPRVTLPLRHTTVTDHNVTFRGGNIVETRGMGQAMGQVDWAGYRRRLDAFEYRAKRQDVPRDVGELLELVREIELSDKIIVDREHYSE